YLVDQTWREDMRIAEGPATPGSRAITGETEISRGDRHQRARIDVVGQRHAGSSEDHILTGDLVVHAYVKLVRVALLHAVPDEVVDPGSGDQRTRIERYHLLRHRADARVGNDVAGKRIADESRARRVGARSERIVDPGRILGKIARPLVERWNCHY